MNPSISFTIFIVFAYLICFCAASPCHPADLRALVQFSGNLTAGSILSNWTSPELCCSWDGVTCRRIPAGGDVRVVALLLPGRGLKGTLSESFASLDRLELLDLSYNRLSGPITAIGAIDWLRVVNISSNTFNGSLPDLSSLPNLTVFNATNNSLSGQIRSDLCLGARRIRVLDLSENQFAGPLPAGPMTNCNATLQELNLACNSFSGVLPSSLFDLVLLESLSLSYNNISGSLPIDLNKLLGLRTLAIDWNRLSGPLPDEFDKLPMLHQLSAHSNNFSGTIPQSLAFCSMLTVLDLRNNSFTGFIDIDFSRMAMLTTLDLASNHFKGSLPISLSSCRELKTLSLAKNNLSGHMPEEFSNLVSLTYISLSNNSFHNISRALSVLRHCKNLTTLILTRNFQREVVPYYSDGFDNMEVFALGNCALTGKIPIWLAECRKLQVLDLSWNHLTGSIPAWIGQLDNLIYLDISNNSLTGEIPKSLTQLKSLVSTNTSRKANSIGMPLYVKRNRGGGLQYNQLSSFPPSLCLNGNHLTGIIWPEFGNLKALHVLDLSNNSITGGIPVTLSLMGNLEVLDLSFNQLNGSIPASLSNLSFLSKFNVAYNDLQGKVPTGGQFFSFPNSSFQGNPGLCRWTCSRKPKSGLSHGISSTIGNRIRRRSILGITISMAVAVAVLLVAVLLNILRKDVGNLTDEEYLEDGSQISCDSGSKLVIFFQNSDAKEISINDILKSTNNFDQANIIGCGGFGLVYKAYLPDGTKAAIKRLSGDCGQMEREFSAEVEALSRAQHKNLVSLRGYCKYGTDRLLIYSYMENGSLDYWLHERVDGPPLLKWDLRLKIAQGSARGLAYLHKICEPNIIHRDVKSSNILLDDKFEAHLADFGLSRLIRPYDTHVTTDLVGTLGYIPPEYSQSLAATLKGDVFSFGVVLLELLTGRRPVDVCKAKGSRNLVSRVLQMKSEKKEEQIFDTTIWNKAHEKQLLTVLETAIKCISSDPRLRPSIEQVVIWLDAVGFDG